jgi:23S rRNA (guanosine2251-2'-O)-methyltransferase
MTGPLDPERTPFQVTRGSEEYDAIRELPVTVLLEDIRSAFNVGSFFRTADAVRVSSLILTGITPTPPHSGVLKTALGAENTVRYEYAVTSATALARVRDSGFEAAVIETSTHAIDLFDWVPTFPVCVVFGNEIDGVSAEVAAACDVHIRIPMLGLKHSLNVSTAGGVVLYELLRKYRRLHS